MGSPPVGFRRTPASLIERRKWSEFMSFRKKTNKSNLFKRSALEQQRLLPSLVGTVTGDPARDLSFNPDLERGATLDLRTSEPREMWNHLVMKALAARDPYSIGERILTQAPAIGTELPSRKEENDMTDIDKAANALMGYGPGSMLLPTGSMPSGMNISTSTPASMSMPAASASGISSLPMMSGLGKSAAQTRAKEGMWKKVNGKWVRMKHQKKAQAVPINLRVEPNRDEISQWLDASPGLRAIVGGAGGLGLGALGTGLGGLMGSAAGAARGNVPEGLGRGLLRGGATGMGAGLGGYGASELARALGASQYETPGKLQLADILGSLLGGAGGWYLSGKAIGEPAGGKKEKKKEVEKEGPTARKPGAIKRAGDMPPFTSQDRPEKVKDVYRALKREHPEMPAEMKARIASRQGKPGKQKQGPPYKGPLTKGGATKRAAGPVKVPVKREVPGSRDARMNALPSASLFAGAGSARPAASYVAGPVAPPRGSLSGAWDAMYPYWRRFSSNLGLPQPTPQPVSEPHETATRSQ